MTRICPSICLSTPGGRGTPARSRQRGYPCWGVPHLGYPRQTWLGGTLPGIPHLRYPHQTWLGGTSAGGYPTLGTPIGPGSGEPCQGGTPPQVPPSDLAVGYPCWGVPNLGYPLSDLATPARGTPSWVPPIGGVVPHLRYPPQTWLGGRYPTSGGVLDTPQSVCLLRSRRRIFLLLNVEQVSVTKKN